MKSPKMTAKRRKSLPKSDFGLPNERKYPMDTRGRASNAKARATTQYKRGNLSMEEKNKIDRKADDILYGKKSKSSTRIKRGGMKNSYKSVSEMREDAKRKGMY